MAEGEEKGRLQRRLLSLAVAVGCVAPVAVLILLSIATRWPAGQAWPAELTGERWGELFSGRGALLESLVLSITLSLAVATVSTAAGYLTSKAIAFSPHRHRLLLLAYIPFAFSPVILGTCLLFLYLRLDLAGTAGGVALAQTMFSYGFAVIFFIGFWTPQKQAYEELVYTLGGSTWTAYRRALLPLSRGLLAVGFFQAFLISWFQYGLTLLVGGGRVKTLPLKVFDYVREANPYYAALASCLLVLPPLVLVLLNRRAAPSFGVSR
ncbi:MAG: ABC transporter permease [Acidobacteriota bacterium]